MNSQQIRGCKNRTNRILEYFDEFIGNAISSRSNNACAKKIAHDLQVMSEFIGEDTPDWIKELINLSNRPSLDGKTVKEIINYKSIVEYYAWDDFSTNNSDMNKLNYDKLFAKEADASGLYEALDRLVACLKIIKDEPKFSLSKQTRIDIESLIKALKNSKGTSESSIKTWVDSAWVIIKPIIPYIDQIETSQEILSKIQDIYDDASLKIIDTRNNVLANLRKEFCNERLLPQPEETKQIEQNASE